MNTINKNLKAALAVVVLLGLPLEVQAYSITIQNAGFESPATTSIVTPPAFWTVGPGGGGTWNINAFPSGFWTVPAPEGNQVAWVSDAPHPGSPSFLSQVLSSSLAANTQYTLSGFVGHPLGFDTNGAGAPTIYTVSLFAGGNLLNSTSGTGPAGSFTTFNLLFNSFGSPFVGQALEVHLGSNQAQTSFDAISLTAVPDGGLTVMLLGAGLAGLGWLRSRS